MSVRDVEKEIKKLQKKKPDKPVKEMDPQVLLQYQKLEEQLKQLMGTKVSIAPKDENKGKIEIEYYTRDEFEAILDRLQK